MNNQRKIDFVCIVELDDCTLSYQSNEEFYSEVKKLIEFNKSMHCTGELRTGERLIACKNARDDFLSECRKQTDSSICLIYFIINLSFQDTIDNIQIGKLEDHILNSLKCGFSEWRDLKSKQIGLISYEILYKVDPIIYDTNSTHSDSKTSITDISPPEASSGSNFSTPNKSSSDLKELSFDWSLLIYTKTQQRDYSFLCHPHFDMIMRNRINEYIQVYHEFSDIANSSCQFAATISQSSGRVLFGKFFESKDFLSSVFSKSKKTLHIEDTREFDIFVGLISSQKPKLLPSFTCVNEEIFSEDSPVIQFLTDCMVKHWLDLDLDKSYEIKHYEEFLFEKPQKNIELIAEVQRVTSKKIYDQKKFSTQDIWDFMVWNYNNHGGNISLSLSLPWSTIEKRENSQLFDHIGCPDIGNVMGM